MADKYNSEVKEIAYDLRQKYALQIGEIRDRIIKARDERNYSEWYNQIDSLFIEVSMKLSKEEKNEWKEASGKMNALILKNKLVYEKNQGDGRSLYSQLKIMNVWLNEMMEKYDLFGSLDKQDYGGL